ncbi:hypothetical protein SAMN05660293_04581 [Dyadobacter psychrophilus]|uniref:Uncharacterized protein n=1 Tax=Dyadobacter psychrophilus TaxID=651661 RepID=A0A1T5GYI7_9BACT|nr:hypothetical protein SAMN05660293_04581 [Dyadobacter psychrophilus]
MPYASAFFGSIMLHSYNYNENNVRFFCRCLIDFTGQTASRILEWSYFDTNMLVLQNIKVK